MRAHRSFLPLCTLAAGATSGLLFLPSATSQSGPNPFAAKTCLPNMLLNGGFEDWPHGTNGAPPAHWSPMGDPANTFTAGPFLGIQQVPGAGDCRGDVGGGEFALQLTAQQPGNYLSQRLPNGTESRCHVVTLTARFMTPFNVCSPEITIDDGLTQSSDTRNLVIGQWQVFTVTHKMAEGATKLEVKIDPDTSSIVDDVQLVCGDAPFTSYVPNTGGLQDAPLGTVISWFQMHPDVPIPTGYERADGGIVTDLESPYFGLVKPNLDERVVRGETDLQQVGDVGGTSLVSLALPSSALSWNILAFPQGPVLQCIRAGISHSTTSQTNWPPYVKLLMLVRVK